MSKTKTVAAAYDNCYLRTADDQTLWLVEKGGRTAIVSLEALQQFGPKPVYIVGDEALERIPLASETISGNSDQAPDQPAVADGGESAKPGTADKR